MQRLFWVSGFFGLLVACPSSSPDDSGDSGVDLCTMACQGRLAVGFADGRSEFQVQLTGDAPFSTLNLACPDNVAAGGPGASGCLEDGFYVTASSYVFPETLELLVDDADEPVTLAPDWTQEVVCATTCSSAEVVVE